MENNSTPNTVKTLRILYPLWVILGMFSIMYIPSTLIETGNNQLTASNISANELLFRVGIVGRIITQLLFILIPLFLYKLFAGVDKKQAALMVVLAFISVPIALYNETNQFAVLSFLDEPSMVRNYLDAYNRGLIIAMIFWGLWLLPLSKLVIKSGYFPKIIGALVFIGGLGYILGTVAEILCPDASIVISMLEYLTFGEVVFILWFVVRGIKSKTTT